MIENTQEKHTRTFLQWKNLTIRKDSKESSTLILDGISGELSAGESLAIMGSSGAGKTTFLNYLSKKNISTNILKKESGDMAFIVNGVNETKSFERLSAYVTQDDILFDLLTPRELFTFATNMRLSHKSKAERQEKVENLITQLGLEKCADTKVGNVLMKGLSGGEKKRTAIGYELIVDPIVIFLDEPTTGLDSMSSLNVIKLITEQAFLFKKIVIFTIHQPTSEIFKQFDRLLLLSEGKIMYQGKSDDARITFSELGYNCPVHFNPAEFFIKVLSKESKVVDKIDVNQSWKQRKTSEGKRDSTLLEESVVQFSAEDLADYQATLKMFNENAQLRICLSEVSDIPVNDRFLSISRNTYCAEFALLFNRNLKVISRNIYAIFVRVGMLCFNSLLVVLLFNNVGTGNNAVIDRKGCLFFIGNSLIQLNMQSNLMVFSMEKPKFYKEQESNMYRVTPYYISKMIVEIPIMIVFTLLLFAITYFAVGLNTSDPMKYFIFLTINFFSGLAATSFSAFLASLFDNMAIIPAVFPFLIYTQLQASGFFVALDDIPLIFWPFKIISLFRWTFHALMWNEFKDLDPNTLDCRSPVKCKYPIDDFSWGYFYECLLALGIILLVNNILSLLALKINVWVRQKRG